MKNTKLKTPFSEYIKSFFVKYLRLHKNGSLKTSEAYEAGMKHFMRWISESKNISFNDIFFEDIDYDTLLDFRNSMCDQGFSQRSCNLYLAANKSYINYSASQNIMLQSIAYVTSKVPGFRIFSKPESYIDNEDALAIFLDSPSCNRHGLRDRTILTCLFDGAFRGNELVSILYGDICWDESVSVVVHGKGRKERTIWFSKETIPLLTQYRTIFHRDLDPLCPFFFTNDEKGKKKMTTRNLERIVDVYANKTKKILECKYGSKATTMFPSKVTPHTLRRTRATLLLRDGANLEEISVFLGHANIETTRQYYAFLSDEQKKNIAKMRNKAIPAIDNDANESTSQTKIWNEGDELSTFFDF